MKPRIWKGSGGDLCGFDSWICTAPNERGVMEWAEGDTPAEAYHNWRAGNATKYAARTPWEARL